MAKYRLIEQKPTIKDNFNHDKRSYMNFKANNDVYKMFVHFLLLSNSKT